MRAFVENNIPNRIGKGFRTAVPRWLTANATGMKLALMGELAVNPNEAQVVRWMFERYLAGDSLGKIAAGLE